MPVAGGIPLLLAAMTLLMLLSIRPHLSGTLIVHPPLIGIFCCALLMLGWETFAALFHYTMRDLELIAARGVWILLGFGYLTLLTGQGPERTARILSTLLLIGCTSLLTAMAMESAFYPTHEVGRQLGTLNVPWPRATGVPQSDGKIGVYLCLASVFFVVGFANTRRWTMLLGLLVSVAPIAFTQSRSTLLGLLLDVRLPLPVLRAHQPQRLPQEPCLDCRRPVSGPVRPAFQRDLLDAQGRGRLRAQRGCTLGRNGSRHRDDWQCTDYRRRGRIPHVGWHA